MTDRAAQISSFLANSIFAGWSRAPLAGDASGRRYECLSGPQGETAILMDAPPASGEDVGPFIAIARHLHDIGLSSPAVHLADPALGLLVIENLGPEQMAQWLARRPEDSLLLYAAAVDVLVELQRQPAPSGLTALTPAHAAAMIAPLWEWYAPGMAPATVDDIRAALQDALAAHAPRADRLALRDYHAENLIWRPDRSGNDRVGLLDFQDAVLAPAEYDLASLLRDARRDVAPDLRDAMIDRFAAATGRNPDACRAALACMAVQRNLRILGVFARLAQRDGKTRYLDLIPRVYGQLREDMAHPALSRLRPMILQTVPQPDARYLERLKVA